MHVQHTCMHEHSMNHMFLNKKYVSRGFAKSPTAQDMFQPIPGLISCAGVTGKWGQLSNVVRAWRSLIHMVGSNSQHLFVQLSFENHV